MAFWYKWAFAVGLRVTFIELVKPKFLESNCERENDRGKRQCKSKRKGWLGGGGDMEKVTDTSSWREKEYYFVRKKRGPYNAGYSF